MMDSRYAYGSQYGAYNSAPAPAAMYPSQANQGALMSTAPDPRLMLSSRVNRRFMSCDEKTSMTVHECGPPEQHIVFHLKVIEPPPPRDDPFCYYCHRTFHLFRHKYNCVQCGVTVCDDDSKGERRLPWYGKSDLERVCCMCEFDIDSGEFEKRFAMYQLAYMQGAWTSEGSPSPVDTTAESEAAAREAAAEALRQRIALRLHKDDEAVMQERMRKVQERVVATETSLAQGSEKLSDMRGRVESILRGGASTSPNNGAPAVAGGAGASAGMGGYGGASSAASRLPGAAPSNPNPSAANPSAGVRSSYLPGGAGASAMSGAAAGTQSSTSMLAASRMSGLARS